MTIDLPTLLLIGVSLAVLLVFGRFLAQLVYWVVIFTVAAFVFLLVADKAAGGQAIDDIALSISNWLKARVRR